MQIQNIINQTEKLRGIKVIICAATYPLDKVFEYGIFKLAKTTRPVSLLRHGGFLYYGN